MSGDVVSTVSAGSNINNHNFILTMKNMFSEKVVVT